MYKNSTERASLRGAEASRALLYVGIPINSKKAKKRERKERRDDSMSGSFLEAVACRARDSESAATRPMLGHEGWPRMLGINGPS